MKHNVCICAFLTEPLFEPEKYTANGIDIVFHKSDAFPNFKTSYNLAVTVCDFDSPECERKFLSYNKTLVCDHHHVFCIGTREKLRAVMEKISYLSGMIHSYTNILKENEYNTSLVSGLVLNYITPLCCNTTPLPLKAYSRIRGNVVIKGYENLSEDELRHIMTNLPINKKEIIISAIGKSWGSLTSNIDRFLPDMRAYISTDLTRKYERVFFIYPDNSVKKNYADITSELEAKFEELFGSSSSSSFEDDDEED